jgi:outer membrane biosynthesis protein TonB
MKTLVRAVAPLLALLALAIGAPFTAAADPTTVIVTAHTSGGTVTATLTGTGTEPPPNPKPEPEPKPTPDPTPQPSPTPGSTPQPSPTPTGEPTSTPAPAKVTLLSVSRTPNSLILTVRCTAGSGGCRGTATVARGDTILAKGPLAARPGKSTERLPLTPAGRRLLAAAKPLSALARAVVHELGTTAKTTASARLTLN